MSKKLNLDSTDLGILLTACIFIIILFSYMFFEVSEANMLSKYCKYKNMTYRIIDGNSFCIKSTIYPDRANENKVIPIDWYNREAYFSEDK